MPAVHAPHAMTVAGKPYRGGEFIPAEAQDEATPDERAALGLPAAPVEPEDEEGPDADAEGEPEEPEPEEEEPEEEDEQSPTAEFASTYFDGDTAADRLKHFADSLDDLDEDDPAFDEALQDAVGDDMVAAPPEEALALAKAVFDAHGYDQADPRVAAVMNGLRKMPPAPPAKFDPSGKAAYGLVDPATLADLHAAEAVSQMLRVAGGAVATHGGVTLVQSYDAAGAMTGYGEHGPGDDGFRDITTDDDRPDDEAVSAHADFFDALPTSPLLAEHDAPESARNFGRVSAGENVEIEDDWDPDHKDTYKPVSPGWYLLRRGTANPAVRDAEAPRYQFVPRKAAGQLVGLPPQYWEGMSQGIGDGDDAHDAADAVEKKGEKAGDVAAAKAMRDTRKAEKVVGGRVGSARDLANRVKGMDQRGEALEGAAGKLAELKDDGEELAVPHTKGSEAEEGRLHRVRDALALAAGHHPVNDSHMIDWDDPRWKEANDAYINHELEPDADHPSAPHYAELRDAIDDLHGEAPNWRDIDTGFDPDETGVDEIDGEEELRKPGEVYRGDYHDSGRRKRDHAKRRGELLRAVDRARSSAGDGSPELEAAKDAFREHLQTPFVDDQLDDRATHAGYKAGAARDADAAARGVRDRHELAADAYGDHFQAMGGHLQRVRDAAAATMPHVAGDEDRTKALKRVHATAGMHLSRLAKSGHWKPPDAYQMAWVPYTAVRKPKTAGKAKGDQIGWREDGTGEIRYVAKKPREIADRPKLAAADRRDGLRDQIRAAVESGDHAALETLMAQLHRDGLRALLKGTGRGAGGKTKAQIAAALIEHARGVQSWHGFAPAGGTDDAVNPEERSLFADVGDDGRDDVLAVPGVKPVPGGRAAAGGDVLTAKPETVADGVPQKRAESLDGATPAGILPPPTPEDSPDADDARPEGAGPTPTDPDGGRRVDGPDPVPDGRGDGGGGTAGIDGPIPVVLARAEHTPAADLSFVPPDLLPHLRAVQQEGVAHAVKAMTAHGGFLLADGPGTGKTRQILAVARRFLDAGKKVLVVAPSEVIKPDWKKGTLYGSFDGDARAMGVPTKLASDPSHLAPGHVAITSYEKMKEFADHIDDDTVLVFDESHFLKNRDSARAKQGQAMAAKAHAVMYSTATPGDKPLHMAYLSRAGVFGTAGREATYKKLGLELHDQHIGGGKYQKIWRINPRVGAAEARRRIGGLYDQLTREGLMVRRELDTSALDFGTAHVPLSAGQRTELADVESKVRARTDNAAVAMMAARLHQEPMKIPATVSAIQEELAAGRSPVVFVGRVNAIGGEGDDSDGDDDAKAALGDLDIESVGTATALKDALLAAGVPAEHIAELHGGATKTPAAKKKSMDSFQSGKARVMIATIQSGGTGVNLDDTTGSRPRTAIIVTPPFSANDMAQAVGRVHRLNTKSRSKVRLMLTDSDVDRRNAATLRAKFDTLSAMAGGQSAASEAVFGDGPAEGVPAQPFPWDDTLGGGIGVGAAHHFDAPAYHNDLAGRHGGRRVKKGDDWTTEFPSRTHFERYRAEAEGDRKAHAAKQAAAREPAPSPARAPAHFRGGTFASLRTGGWGVRAPSGAKVGDTVTVTTKSGRKQDVKITKVVATFGDAVLAEFS